MITDWRWNKIAKRNVIMRLYFNKLCGHAIMCDNELGRNYFHCVVTEILIVPPTWWALPKRPKLYRKV